MSAPAVNYHAVVNANTANREAAGLFLQTMIGMDAQYEVFSNSGIPVNTALIDTMRAYYLDGTVHPDYPFEIRRVMPEAAYAYYFERIDGMRAGEYIDKQTASGLTTVLAEYPARGSFSDALGKAQSQLALYLGE